MISVKCMGRIAERYDEARPTAGATGASAAGVRAKVVASGEWCVPGMGVN